MHNNMAVRNRPKRIAHAALGIMLCHCSFFHVICSVYKSHMSVVIRLAILRIIITTMTLFYGAIVSPVRSNDVSIVGCE